LKIRAFVFDDSEHVRSSLSSILKDRGYEVYAFSDLGTCPLYLHDKCPCPLDHSCGDFIITDINMPGCSGLDFIENQLKHDGCKSVNFAVMSFKWTFSQFAQAKRLGCHILRKPFDPDDLCKWLDKCEKKIDPDRKLSDWFKLEDKTVREHK
jgi:DNA-binding NtrC family response regulator